MTPKRIQRERTRGWRMPPNAVYVGRPSKWGNPWTIAEWCNNLADMYLHAHHTEPSAEWLDETARDIAVTCFRQAMDNRLGDPDYPRHEVPGWYPTLDEIRAELRGRDLACWCPLDQPCHADVLLEIANREAAAR